MGELSPLHWLIVIAVAVMLFGAKRLPDAARSLGRSARILKAELSGLHEHDDIPTDTPSDQHPETPDTAARPSSR
jgi:sec-independent protein translocase protein TatA